MTTANFVVDLEFSRGQRLRTDAETIQAMIHGCVDVRVATLAEERKGIDYIATLRRGAEIKIDAKTRRAGCSKWWVLGMPEVGLERWSKKNSTAGWTLNEASETDYVYFYWDPSDHLEAYLVPFQLLRMAFAANINRWFETHRNFEQPQTGSDGISSWTSEVVLVPLNEVLKAIERVQRRYVVDL